MKLAHVKNSSGQALLLVLLGMAVILTIVLSILSSSVTDVRITTTEEDALRAFSAAEAGVERALITGGAATGSLGDSNFNANITTIGQAATSYIYPSDVAAGDTATIWMVSHGADDVLICDATSPCFRGRDIKLCWGKSGTANNVATTPALEVAVYYANTPGNYGTIRIGRANYDPNSGRLATNSFVSPDAGTCTIGTTTFAFQKTINLSTLGIPATSYNVANGLQMVRVRLLYNTDRAQSVGIDTNFAGNSNFPTQAIQIESTGTAGDSTRKVQVLKSYADLPPIFDAAIFSPIGITK